MSNAWYELRIQVTPETKESITDYLFGIGVEAVNESLTQPSLLQVYVSAEARDNVIQQLKDFWPSLVQQHPTLSSLSINAVEIPDENWAEEYKKYYTAQPLTDLFFLRPEWDKTTPIPNGMIPVVMDPGQAFGTGLHPSTKLCLKTIQSQILESTQREKLKCLDVGTGTGILALAAYHLGTERVVGIDNDPIAIEVAKQNMILNGVQGIQLSTQDIKSLKTQFDFVISNILLETHRELSREYARLIPQGGLLLLSGLLGYQKLELFSFILPLGFSVLECKNYQEWASFLFVRRDKP